MGLVKTWTVRVLHRRTRRELRRFTVLAASEGIAADAVLRDWPDAWGCDFRITERKPKQRSNT
jgi:hypothetical protein